MRSKIIALLATLTLLTGLCAGALASTAEAPTLMVVPKGLDNRIFLDMKSGAQAEGKALGLDVQWTGPATSDAQKQLEVVEALIERGVDGMLISCNDAALLQPAIEKALEAGIAVATFDSDAPDSGRLFYIGSDNYALGQEGARQLRALLPEGGKVAVLEGLPDALNLRERLAGFMDGLEGSGIECYPPVSGQDDFQTSVSVVEDFTAQTQDLDAWFFVGGWPLFAEPQALPNLTAFAQAGGHVVAVDAAWPMLRFVEEGIVDVLIGQGYTEMGEVGIRTLLAAVNGELPGEDTLYAGFEIVTPDNLEAVRAGKTPW